MPEQRDRVKAAHLDDKSVKKAAMLKVQRDAEAPIREAIRRGDYPLTLNQEKQARHMEGTAKPGRSVITIPIEELQEIINEKAGSGKIEFQGRTFVWNHQEIIDAGREIGYTVNRKGDIIKAQSIKIHYSKTGTHAIPRSWRWKK